MDALEPKIGLDVNPFSSIYGVDSPGRKQYPDTRDRSNNCIFGAFCEVWVASIP